MIPVIPIVGSLLASSTGAQAAPAAADAAAASGAGFEQVFAKAAQAIGDLKSSEATAISGLKGDTPVQEVVESVMTAQRALQTAIAVRDKLVSAYQTISQMPI